MAGVLQHLRSSTLNKRPNPASMVDGQVAINYASGSPGMFFKDSNGSLVKVGPVHVGSGAPNVSPASGGTAGNSLGEQWLDTSGGTYVFKIWDGSAWRSEAGEFVNAAGDTMTGSLTMGVSANIIFEGSVDDGFETTLTVANPTADRTITLPNVTGTVVTTGDNGSVTSTMIANGTIVDADVNASAAIAGTKVSPNFGSQTVQTTGIFSAAGGSAAAPSIAFTGDTNTGIYSPGADQVAVATNGTGRLFVDANGDIGIGTPSPQQALDIAGTTGLHLRGVTYTDFSNFWGSTDNRAMFLPYGFLGSSGANALSLYANGYRNNTSSFTYMGIAGNTSTAAGFDLQPDGNIIFRNGTAVGTVLPERLRITSAGLVGIGTSSPVGFLDIAGTSGTYPTQQIRHSAIETDGEFLRIARTDTSNIRYHSIHAKNSGSGLIGNNYIQFKLHDPLVSTTAQNTVLHLDGTSGGRVGIGTTSPSDLLHVSGGNILLSDGYDIKSPDNFAIYDTAGARDRFNFSTGNTYNTRSGGAHAFQINNSEAARIDSSGRLLVGTSTARVFDSATATLTPLTQVESTGAESAFSITRNNTANTGPGLFFGKSRSGAIGGTTIVVDGDRLGTIFFEGTDGANLIEAASIASEVDGTPGANDMPGRLVFSTTADGASSPTERMRIASDGKSNFSGYVYASTSVTPISTVYENLQITNGGFVSTGGSATTTAGFESTTNSTSTRYHLVFSNPNGVVGSITTTTSATAYNTSSDYRLKENVTPVSDGITRLQQLKPSRFNFIADPAKTVDGFIAHEVQDIVPEAITGEKDAVNDEGNPIYQGIDQSKLVPLLTAALQEAIGEIESLKARVAALEAN